MAVIEHLRMIGRALPDLAALSLGLLGGTGSGPDSPRPRLGFQSYALHQAQFYGPLISRLLDDGVVDVYWVILPHPQFSRQERESIRRLAEGLGLPPSRIVPYWKTLWWKLDLAFYTDVLAGFPLRRTRNCLLFHGAVLSQRCFKKRWPRKDVFAFDIAFPFGRYDLEVIEARREEGARTHATTAHAVGCPLLDGLLAPRISRADYLRRSKLDEDRPTVLYAPHWADLNAWGAPGGRILTEVVDALAGLPVNLILKPHAMSYVPGAMDGRRWLPSLRGQERAGVRLDTDVDDRPALCHADVLVSGLSSRIFNFMLLDKPAVLFRDSLDTSEPLGRRRLELMRSVYPVADGIPRLVELVQRALRDPGQGSDRRRIQADAIFANPGRATDAVVRVIYDALGVARLLREG